MTHHKTSETGALLSDIYMLAACNTATLLVSQINLIIGEKGNGGVLFTCSSWIIRRYSGMSAVCRMFIVIQRQAQNAAAQWKLQNHVRCKFATSAPLRQSCFHQLIHVDQLFIKSNTNVHINQGRSERVFNIRIKHHLLKHTLWCML